MKNRKVVVYVCKNNENAIENLRGDGLLILGCGYGDPSRSGMVAAFGDIGDEFLYRLGAEMPYRFAYYACNGVKNGLDCLLAQGCRSVVVDFGVGTECVRSELESALLGCNNVIIAYSSGIF